MQSRFTTWQTRSAHFCNSLAFAFAVALVDELLSRVAIDSNNGWFAQRVKDPICDQRYRRIAPGIKTTCY